MYRRKLGKSVLKMRKKTVEFEQIHKDEGWLCMKFDNTHETNVNKQIKETRKGEVVVLILGNCDTD